MRVFAAQNEVLASGSGAAYRAWAPLTNLSRKGSPNPMPQARFSHSFSTSAAMLHEVKRVAQKNGVSLSAIINRALEQYFAQKVARTGWETTSDDEWYDGKNFYTHSSDKQGHSHAVKLAIPKNLQGQIGRVVGSGAIPEYRTPQDFYRDALFHRAHDVARWIDDGDLTREITMLILQAEEEMIAQNKRDAEQLISATRDNLDDALRRGDTDWMKAHISDRMSKSSSIPEAFREEYRMLLKKYLEMARSGFEAIEGDSEAPHPVTQIKRRGRPRKESAS